MSTARARPFRFGIQLATPLPGLSWADTARQVESLGFSTLFIPDHFGDQLAPISALSVAAAVTTELKVGALVFDNDYRHPVTLAKEMATLDVLSDGRVELGLGAGWMKTDYEQSGIAYDRPGIRIDRMIEAISVIRGCHAAGPFDFSGEHYEITGYDAQPLPVGPMPLLLGGGGPRMLKYCAQEAEIVGINANMKAGEIGPDAVLDLAAESIDRKLEWVRNAAGDRFAEIELSMMAMTTPTDDRDGTISGIAELFGAERSLIEETPILLIGSTSSMIEDLQARRERWQLSYIVVSNCTELDAISPVISELAGR